MLIHPHSPVQALSDENAKQSYMKGKKTLEINPRHPLIKELKNKAAGGPEDELTRRLGMLLYESALVESGFNLEDVKGFGARMSAMVRDTLGVPESATVEDEPAEGSEGAEVVEDDAAGGDEDASAKAARDVEEAMAKMPKPGAGGDDADDAGHDGDEL